MQGLGLIATAAHERKNERAMKTCPPCDKLWIFVVCGGVEQYGTAGKYFCCANEVGVPSWLQQGSV